MAFLFFLTLSFLIPSVAIGLEQEVGIGASISGCNNNGICEQDRGENSTNCPFDCPPPTPPPGAVFIPDTTPPTIYNLFISKITLNSATIEWKTNEQALCQIFWGKTSKYKEGNISETTFTFLHKTELTDLSSGTTYHFKISCRDTNRNESETIDQMFTTLSPPDITPPANVSNFEAIPSDSQTTLKWQNPPDPDFKAVKIMRSEKFYPKDPWEGEMIYDGKGTSFVDTGLTNGVRYYYTAFAYDYAGNYSSGAIVSAIPFKIKPPPPPEEITTEKECLETGFYWYDDACHPEPKVVPPPPEVEKITLENFDFIQEGEKIPLKEEIKIKTETKKPITISIDYEKVPEVLKTIMVTLEKDDKFFSFLLRINKEKTAYLATLMAPEDSGVYPVTITILDYKNQTLKKIPGQLIVSEVKPPPAPIPWHEKYRLCIYILVGMIVGAGIGFLIWRRRKKKIV